MPRSSPKNAYILSDSYNKFLDKAVAVMLDRPTAKDTAFLARQLVQATLPHSDPKTEKWARRNGNFALGIQAGFNPLTGETYGLPYGSIPRLLLFWITTEAIRTKARRLELGTSLAQFMRNVGLNPDTGGGKRGDAARLQEQMRRLINARITFHEQDEQHERRLNMEVAPDYELWWNPRQVKQDALWQSWIELGEKFFQAILAAPIPVDTRALKALKRSPLALDLYSLLCYESYRVQKNGKPRFIAWRSLMEQLGAEYQAENASWEFARYARQALRKIQAVMPSLKLEIIEGGFTILDGSTPPIPSRTAPELKDMTK